MAVFRLYLGRAGTAAASGEIEFRVRENDDDAITEIDDERVSEQALTLDLNATLAATVGPASLSAAATLQIAGAVTATLQSATIVATGALRIAGTVSQTLAPATLSAAGLAGEAAEPISGAVSITLQPATAEATATTDAPYRGAEDGVYDRVSEDDAWERIPEAYTPGYSRLEATLSPATLEATSQGGRVGIVDPLYLRVTETSPSSLHPALGGDFLQPAPDADLLHRVTERSLARVPGETDFRILQRQLLGTLRLVAEATVRVHVAERHFLWASRRRIECVAARSRIQLRGRSDFRKTRGNA